MCEYKWLSEPSSGLRTHNWKSDDCSHGRPRPNWIAFGQGTNANGSEGEATCTSMSGSQFNHPELNSPSIGSVRCLYVDSKRLQNAHPEKKAPVTMCSVHFPDQAVGWRQTTWVPSDCSNGIPNHEYFVIGQAQNQAKMRGQPYCSWHGVWYFNQSLYGAAPGKVNCLFIHPESLKIALKEAEQPPAILCRASFHEAYTGWQSLDWNEKTCIGGVPSESALVIGQSRNEMGTSGQGLCSTKNGMHYNHPYIDRNTTGTVDCLFLTQGGTTRTLASPAGSSSASSSSSSSTK
jgi:hypothetical protein